MIFLKKRIEPNDGDKICRCEIFWKYLGIMKEKTREKSFENFDSLVGFVNSEWPEITLEQHDAMMGNILKRFSKVVQLNGNQAYEILV